ncbi:SusE domain-containing protein [Flavobacteriaceae bacterium AH-315-B10]|nr:SusE domain-containing protein [Flavobacteriaceae bacterium AH-315-B10]
MKKMKILALLILAIIGFNSCEDDDALLFIAQAPEELSFTNEFLSEYVLTNATAGNLGERFTWSSADFDVPTVISYDLQKSILGDFSDMEVVGTTTENELAVTIGNLLSYADEAGLDNDPNSPEPNTGDVYFRIRAYVGTGPDVLSDMQVLTLVLPENVGGGPVASISDWGVVGSGYNNWGAYADGFFYTTDQPNVFVSYVTLFDGEIKFRENNDWGVNFGDTGADGTLDAGGDNIVVSEGNYKIVIDFNTNTYTIEAFTWGVVGSAFNDWGATPDGKFYYDYTTDTFKVGIKLLDGEMKFRFNNDWGLNLGDTGGDGTLEEGGDNIVVTAGFYAITLDINNNTYTIESADLWGVVGSGYNDWGATPDFTFTEVNPDVWIAEVVTLLDGEIKFRINEDWGVNIGDTGADGSLDAGGDNIVVSAGNARIWIDILNNTYTINQ